MVDEIVFLESEIIQDDSDENVPVGKLVKAPTKTPKQRTENARTASSVKKDVPGPEKTTASNKTDIPSEHISQTKNVSSSDSFEDADNAPVKVENKTSRPVGQESIKKAAVQQEKATALASNDKEKEPKPRSKKAAVIVENEQSDSVSKDSTHIRTSIKKLSSQSTAQNVLGKTDFSIDYNDTNNDKKPIKKAPAAKKKPNNDPWAVADIKKKNKGANVPENAYNESMKPEQDTKKKSNGVKTATIVASASKTAQQSDEANKKTVAAKSTAKNKNKSITEEKNMAKETTKTEIKTTAKPATKESTETVIVEGDASVPHGKFVIKRTDNDNFVFKLFSSNKRVVAVAAGQYTSLGACKNGIQSVMNNSATAPIEDQTLKNVVEQKCPKWIIFEDKRGEFRLRLIASNGNMVAATNDGYLSKDAAKKGIEAIARASKGADVVRNDDLW